MTNLNEFPKEARCNYAKCNRTDHHEKMFCGGCYDAKLSNDMRSQCLAVHNRIVAEKDKEIERLKEKLQLIVDCPICGNHVHVAKALAKEE